MVGFHIKGIRSGNGPSEIIIKNHFDGNGLSIKTFPFSFAVRRAMSQLTML